MRYARGGFLLLFHISHWVRNEIGGIAHSLANGVMQGDSVLWLPWQLKYTEFDGH